MEKRGVITDQTPPEDLDPKSKRAAVPGRGRQPRTVAAADGLEAHAAVRVSDTVKNAAKH